MSGGLFVVATPIGNLGDVSERARSTLASADLVAAEDTRRTGRLLQALGVRTKLVSLFEGNERARTEELLERLRAGATIALVSDGGTPLISDPGYRLVSACIGAGIDVHVIPGPSAVLAALVVSGLPTDRFAFEGFLPRTAGPRRTRLTELASEPRTLVVFESPRRVNTLLRDAEDILGPRRRVAICRELTKLHEEVMRGSVADVRQAIGDGPLRGEVVVVIEGAAEAEADGLASLEEARALVAAGVRKREAAHRVAAARGASANELYRALLEAP